MVFTIFPGQLTAMLKKTVGAKAMSYTYTYPTPPLVAYRERQPGPVHRDFCERV